MIASQTFIDVSTKLTLFIYKGIKDMKKNKVLYKTITTQQGEIDNKCPACNGECVDIFDYTHARGGDIKVRLCQLCDGRGIAIEGIDYKSIINYDEEGNQHVYLETIEENRYDSNR